MQESDVLDANLTTQAYQFNDLNIILNLFLTVYSLLFS
jgi:hypothetical protein